MENTKRLYRSETDKVFGGVAGGFGEYFQIDSNLIRIAFVLLTFAGGSGFVLYLICWLVIPTRTSEKESTTQSQRGIAHNIEVVGEELKSGRWINNLEGVAGAWLIILGVIFLLVNFGILAFSWLSKLWPILLILVGLHLYSRKK